jgi:Flp pilus assembly pilin Flp
MAERWYYIIGTVLAALVAIIVIGSVRFLVGALNTALNPSLIKVGTTVTFNVDKLKGILEKK